MSSTLKSEPSMRRMIGDQPVVVAVMCGGTGVRALLCFLFIFFFFFPPSACGGGVDVGWSGERQALRSMSAIRARLPRFFPTKLCGPCIPVPNLRVAL